MFYKRLASRLATKWDQPYSTIMAWLRCWVTFSLLRSAIQCIRGDRSSCGQVVKLPTPPMDPVVILFTKLHLSTSSAYYLQFSLWNNLPFLIQLCTITSLLIAWSHAYCLTNVDSLLGSVSVIVCILHHAVISVNLLPLFASSPLLVPCPVMTKVSKISTVMTIRIECGTSQEDKFAPKSDWSLEN